MTLRGEDGEVRTIALAELRDEAETVGAPLPIASAAVAADDSSVAETTVDVDVDEERRSRRRSSVAGVTVSETSRRSRSPTPTPRRRRREAADGRERRPHRRRGRRGGRRNRPGGRPTRRRRRERRRHRRHAPSGEAEWRRFYLTTAIDYANGDPHIGHAYEKIGADAIARYRRMRGDDVQFLTGIDEHGQKVAQAAAERGVSPQEFVDDIAARFEAMWQRLSISYDQFMRTTDAGAQARRARADRAHPRAHRPTTSTRRRTRAGTASAASCSSATTRSSTASACCIRRATLEWTTERNWFFRLTQYADFLRTLLRRASRVSRARDAPQRDPRRCSTRGSRTSRSRARKLSWAIPFPIPLSTGETQGTWVWFDALPNYLTATGFPDDGLRRCDGRRSCTSSARTSRGCTR